MLWHKQHAETIKVKIALIGLKELWYQKTNADAYTPLTSAFVLPVPMYYIAFVCSY